MADTTQNAEERMREIQLTEAEKYSRKNKRNTEMGKAADPADISVLFFPAGANFWHMHAPRAI